MVAASHSTRTSDGRRSPSGWYIAVGDAVEPVSASYPTLLGTEQPVLLAYPREVVVAEKLEAIVKLGENNTRLKDLFDLWFLFTTYDDAPEALVPAVEATFIRRGTEIPRETPIGLSEALAEAPMRLSRWFGFVKRSRITAPPLAEVTAVVRGRAGAAFALLVRPPSP